MNNIISKTIDEKLDLISEINSKIWKYAELSLKETKSCDLYIEKLKELGYAVEGNYDNIKTAFCAKFGKGKPVIGILAEYDALSGMSQKAGITNKEPIVKDANGHGCQHNVLGAGSLAAFIGVAEYLKQTNKKGTVILYGCPGEEACASKAFMARDGIWQDLDCALTWHPNSVNKVNTGSCMSCIQKEYVFKGVSAHAAGAPHLGRSALDAVELMNIGVQFLREHMPTSARVHYAITNSGGISPNVVQAESSVVYMVRDIEITDTFDLQKRVDKIAKAAADMTETSVSINFIDGCSNIIPNDTLSKVLYESFEEVGVPHYTQEELEFAKALKQSIESAEEDPFKGSPGVDDEIMEFIKNKTNNFQNTMNDFLVPYKFDTIASPGSTDVGDVSYIVPTAQINVVCSPLGTPGHSWQNVSCGNTSIAQKAAICAGKVIANTAVKLFEKPEIIEQAKIELKNRTEKGYICPVPDGAKAE